MPLQILFIFLMSILVCVYASGLRLNLTAKPSPSVVNGSKVTLRCMVDVGVKRTLQVNWMHGEIMVGENCDSFNVRKSHKATCGSRDPKTSPYYDFILDPVVWEDRGKWSCYYGMNYSELHITVVIPPTITNHIVKKEGEVEGEGSRSKPFDLTMGQAFSMTCMGGCSFPASDLMWTFKNATSNGRIGEPRTVNSPKKCVKKKGGMLASSSTFHSINCTKHHFVGLNRISCSVDPKLPVKYDGGIKSREIYFLCPGGTQAPVLTYGEIIAIAVGSAIALILIFLNCFLFKESRRKAILRNRALSV